jgi:hypothetical protein
MIKSDDVNYYIDKLKKEYKKTKKYYNKGEYNREVYKKRKKKYKNEK